MSLNKHLREQRFGTDQAWKDRLVQWRKDPTTLRIEHPTRLDRARALGYKAKTGLFMVRQRTMRTTHIRPRPKKGKQNRKQSIRLDLAKNYQMICEERANRKFVNCEVVNSYYVGQDGKHFWFEVIMATPELLMHDHRFQHLVNQRGRVFRGLTSAGKKMRGMRWKGKGAEKSR